MPGFFAIIIARLKMELKELIEESKQAIEKADVKNEGYKTKALPHVEVVLHNDSDFVLRRTTSTTSKLLMCILSQGLVTIKDEKTGVITKCTTKDVQNFLAGTDFHNILDKGALPNLKYIPWTNRQKPELSSYITLGCSYPEKIKMVVNNKIFIKGYEIDELLKYCSTEQDIKKYATALEFVNKYYKGYDKMKMARILLQISTDLKALGINYDKIKYNMTNFDILNKNNELISTGIFYGGRRDDLVKVIEFGNLDFNKFVDYLVYLHEYEGVNFSLGAAVLDWKFTLENYYDYLKMQKEMFGKIVEKYPKNYLTEKQKLNANYSIWKEKHKEDIMLQRSEAVKGLEYKKEPYCIIIPQKTGDIIDEGYQLGHCVGSYVDKVLSGETNIVFMRKTTTPEKSLVTVEVKNGAVIQFRGKADRDCTGEELDFLIKWAKEKKLYDSNLVSAKQKIAENQCFGI